jgi:[protein-PII] uridylyltransferase
MGRAEAAIDLGELAPMLGSTCRDYLRVYSDRLESSILRGEGGVALSRLRAAVLDGLLSALFCAADAAAQDRRSLTRARESGPLGRGTAPIDASLGRGAAPFDGSRGRGAAPFDGSLGRGGAPIDGSLGRGGAPIDGSLGRGGAPIDGSLGRGGAPIDGRSRVALVAVGSYGRGTLSLKSDVDVVFLCDDPEEPRLAALTEAFLYPLWDIGLKVGHAVRGIDETLALAHTDISTATTLLDLRRVGGDASIVRDLIERGRSDLFGTGLGGFLEALEKDTYERHERYGGSLYLLEPEVKLGRGGLRDIDVGLWAARARWHVPTLEGLIRAGAMEERELVDLRSAQDFLWRTRNLLHLRGKRSQDRLTFEDQEEIALRLGYQDGATLGVEQFMQNYYRAARSVAGLSERLLKRSRPHRPIKLAPLTDLSDGIVATENQLGFKRPWVLDARPELALTLFTEVIRHLRPITEATRDDIAAWAGDPSWCQVLRRAPDASALFCKLLCHAGEVPLRRNSILGELHELGLFLAMVPEFEQVTGRVQHDVYHVYTVDVHSIAAVDRLRALMRGDYALEFPFASQLAAETPRPLPLFLGLLLHDVGKAYGKEHSKEGALMARPIAERLGLPPLDVDHVVWLVQEHLSLYHWATRRDTSDPATIEEVARTVGSIDRLRDLYLLTIADVSTTNPQAMTEWKARMLEDLYIALSRVLEGRAPNLTQRAEELRRNARIGFVGDLGQERLEAFVDEMPERYVLAHPVDMIRAHARAARDRGDKAVHVAAFPGPAHDISEILVLTDDHPGLLASIAAALSANRVEITAAQIFSRQRRGRRAEAVDILHVRPSGRAGESLAPQELFQVSQDIEAVLRGRVTAEQLLGKPNRVPSWARRRGPEVRTKVVIDNAASSAYTVVDVYARDHVGLLYAIAHVLHEEGLSIALSKVNTEGLKAADVFYVERAEGGKLDPERCEALRQKLVDAIETSRERES